MTTYYTYQELENKVKEMQAEIDRLKAQEQKEVRTFKDDIWKVLDDFRKKSQYSCDVNCLDEYTDTICEIVEGYIPVPQIERDDYGNGYNTAILQVKKNLGLDT